MEHYRFAGYRVVRFPAESKQALREIAARLVPHEDLIVDNWIEMQFAAWQPPGLSSEQLRVLFGGLLSNMLDHMASGELEECVSDLEVSGASLARSEFPYEALIVSLHFLEESYMPFLLNPRSERTQEWLIKMDEFLHVGIAALATSYFEFHKMQLMAEAEVGRIVQEALTPHPPKRIGDVEIGFVYASASERARLGGDFLEVFEFGSDGTSFLIGDMSGHGIDAAANSAAIRSMFRGFMRDRQDVSDALERLNRVLVKDLDMNQFATALAGVYTEPGRLILANAGHPLPILGETMCREIRCSGLPLGVLDEAVYEQIEVELPPGGVFVCYTDGLSEARTGTELFGESRVCATIEEMADADARSIAEHLRDKALRFASGRLMDDMAVLVLKRAAST